MTEPVAYARRIADAYCADHGLPVRPSVKHPADPDFGRRTADAYEALPVTSEDARDAYAAFVAETEEQAAYIRAAGVRIIPTAGDPYKGSAAMAADVARGQLKVYASETAHPFMTDAQTVTFRAVHDFMAHAAEGNQFGPRGELNAAIRHASMYSPLARRALLSETHGQNSWVNYSEHVLADGRTVAETNRDKPGTVYADQRAALLPESIIREFETRYIPGSLALVA